ncbi:LysR family transcriptional regulator [Paenibacillus sp. A3]|uniref:LysR family transcriptional regulator n=1 Tax=Paenibacillus sp. A3 TaxID=1337054 RepID=UPI0006D5A5C3|nr:LysR family transcriptional regulator [Paenibacillus sp. A3]KPV61349.1 LysR family transcriptional regulator [Paenibacillus sp. A3]
MNLTKYEIFCTVVEFQSLTKAGEKLNLTQPAVSHAVSSLEQEIGFPLLIRNRSGISLTSNGERILEPMREIVRLNEKLKQEFASIRGLVTGTVCIGTFSSVSIQWLPAILKEFQQKYPLIEIELLEGNYNDIEQWVLKGSVDFGFMALPVSGSLEVMPLKRDKIFCIVPKDHVLQKEDKINIEQLREEPFIMPKKGCDLDVKRIFSENNITPKVKYELEDDHAIIAMVNSGIGVSLLPEMILSHIPGNVKVLELEGDYYRSIGIAMASRKNISPAAKKFIDCVQSWVKPAEAEEHKK